MTSPPRMTPGQAIITLFGLSLLLLALILKFFF